MQFEANTIKEEKTRLLYQVNIMQRENSDIRGKVSNMVSNHGRAEKEISKLNTVASENMKAVEEIRQKNYKSVTENADLESKINGFFG